MIRFLNPLFHSRLQMTAIVLQWERRIIRIAQVLVSSSWRFYQHLLGCKSNHFLTNVAIGYLYQWTGEDWTKIAQVEGDSIGDRFGGTTSLSGDCQWVVWGGSQQENVAGSGYVKVFEVQDLVNKQGNNSTERE